MPLINRITLMRKYPRTPHLPYSRTISEEDAIAKKDYLLGKEVVVLEKMDGECTAMYSDYIHARSLDSAHHPSRSWVKQLHAKVKSQIPENMIIYGENLYAKHSIPYSNLNSYFMVFNIHIFPSLWLSWRDVRNTVELIGLHTVPLLYEGVWTERLASELIKHVEADPNTEGFVVRLASSFTEKNWKESIGKYVSSNFEISSDHWTKNRLIANKLKAQTL
jgi:RNA ligase